MEYEPPRGWWGVWENTAAVAFKNGRLRIEAPVRLSHAESWREGVVIHCKGYRLHPRNRMPSVPGQAAPQEHSKKRGGMVRLSCVGPRKGNAPETHGTRNGTHGNVGKVDMCVLNPAPRNPGWKWGRSGCFNHTHQKPFVLLHKKQPDNQKHAY
ncbi:hypothetical protein YC2023_114830 [Brassica napus]